MTEAEAALRIYPAPALALDYALGAAMWTLLARAALDLFIPPQSAMVIAKVFRQITAPLIRLFAPLTPRFLAPILIPVYVAWWFYLARFFAVPYFLFGEIGMLSFPLESALGKWIGSL